MSNQIQKLIDRVVECLEEAVDVVRNGRTTGRLVPEPVPVRIDRPFSDRRSS